MRPKSVLPWDQLRSSSWSSLHLPGCPCWWLNPSSNQTWRHICCNRLGVNTGWLFWCSVYRCMPDWWLLPEVVPFVVLRERWNPMRQLSKAAAKELTKSNLWPTLRVQILLWSGIHWFYVIKGRTTTPILGKYRRGIDTVATDTDTDTDIYAIVIYFFFFIFKL